MKILYHGKEVEFNEKTLTIEGDWNNIVAFIAAAQEIDNKVNEAVSLGKDLSQVVYGNNKDSRKLKSECADAMSRAKYAIDNSSPFAKVCELRVLAHDKLRSAFIFMEETLFTEENMTVIRSTDEILKDTFYKGSTTGKSLFVRFGKDSIALDITDVIMLANISEHPDIYDSSRDFVVKMLTGFYVKVGDGDDIVKSASEFVGQQTAILDCIKKNGLDSLEEKHK